MEANFVSEVLVGRDDEPEIDLVAAFAGFVVEPFLCVEGDGPAAECFE